MPGEMKNNKNNKYIAPDGSKWNSRTDYCKSIGINPRSVASAIYKGASESEAIQRLLDKLNDDKCFDHKENKFASVKEKCKHYGISYNAYWDRIKHGCSEKQALETPSGELRGLGFFCEKGKYIAPDGSEWASCAAYCRNIGINYYSFKDSVYRGVSDEVAIQRLLERGDYFDHLGNKFSSLKDKCAHYGISSSTYLKRKKIGWTEKDALETPVRNTPLKLNEEGLKKCQKAGINPSVVRQRIGRGIKDEDVLFAPVIEKEYFDHKNIKYSSLNEMCETYNIISSTYLNRIARGWSTKRALETPLRPKREDHIGEEAISRCGLKMQIIDVNNTDGYLIKFEDGVFVKRNNYGEFADKKIPHPTLKIRGIGSFLGYTTKYVATDTDNNAWYETEKDGVKDIMTPQMMLESLRICR